MRRIVFGFMSTLSGLVLLFSYHTSLGSSSSSAAPTPAAGTGTSSTGGTTPAPSSSSSSGSSSSRSSSSGSYTGDTVDTRWGPVQVKITVTGGKITKSEAVQYPTANPRDQQINAYAVPALNSEVLQKQSGSIDAISGATVTSDGYIQSLQSAIDQANL
jgi:uncharacterized protein with FMN-binding domain